MSVKPDHGLSSGDGHSCRSGLIRDSRLCVSGTRSVLVPRCGQRRQMSCRTLVPPCPSSCSPATSASARPVSSTICCATRSRASGSSSTTSPSSTSTPGSSAARSTNRSRTPAVASAASLRPAVRKTLSLRWPNLHSPSMRSSSRRVDSQSPSSSPGSPAGVAAASASAGSSTSSMPVSTSPPSTTATCHGPLGRGHLRPC